MATIITGTNGTNGTNGASPTNGTKGGNASYTKNGVIGADTLDYDVKGGKGGKGGNGTPPPANGANGGNGGDAAITINGNIFNNPAGTDLLIKGVATGGEGGDPGTGVAPGLRGNGGNANVTFNGNIINPNKVMNNIALYAEAIGGDGASYGNATATVTGNIVQPKSANNVFITASAHAFGPDVVANHGNAAFGTKTATVNGNIVQGNIQNVSLTATAVPSNGTARINGNIIQLSGALTTSGAVTLAATGNVLEITNNKVTVNKQSLTLSITQFNPYTATIQNNEFYGSGTNFFTFSAAAIPGPYSNTVSVNLATNSFVYNSLSNILSGFNSVTMAGNVVATLVGNNNDNVLTGAGGDDFFTGGKGNDALNGGLGIDTAIYSGNFADYTVAVNILGNGTVTDNTPVRDGTDTLTSIEFLQFADGIYNTALGLFVPFGPPNTAPVLDASKAPFLATELEDAVAPVGAVGTLVSSLVDFAMPAGQVDNVTDPDLGALLGIALTGTDTANGAWFYSIDNGMNWLAVGAVSDAAARLLAADANTRLYFQPAANFNGSIPSAITFRAWDQTSGVNGGTGNAAVNGGMTAFSAASDTAILSITAVNDAPVLDASKSPVLNAVLEDAGIPMGAVGTVVGSLVDFASPSGQVDNVTDVDASPLLGIALTGVNNANGAWFYSINFGVNWTPVGPVSDAAALLLNPSARLYFQPNANYNGSSDITFRAWDQTSGVNGGLGNAGVNGGTTAFSAVNDTASITVTAVNDAPVLDASKSPTLTAIMEDPAAPTIGSGTLISALVDFASPSGQVDNVTDADAGAQLGIAITGIDAANGGWLYSTDNGATWFAINPAVTDATAVLLAADANTRLFFQPSANYNGGSSITFRAWDLTTGTNGGSADASVNGGSTAFSAASDTATIFVGAVNDAPVLDASKSPALAGEPQNAGFPMGAVGTVVSSLVDFATPSGQVDNVTDPDSGALLGIALTGVDSTNGTWFYSVNFGVNWTPVGPVSDSVALLLDPTARLYFQPNLNFTGTITNAITFRAWDQTSGTNGGLGNASVNGGATAFSAANDTASLSIVGGENYFGTPGNDNHTGTIYDDVMHVSGGTDTLNGGGHILGDTLTFDTADAGVTATINSVTTGFSVGGIAGTTTSLNFEHLTGSNFDDILVGDNNFNIINGGDGDDLLVATPGGDTLDGGANGVGGDTADFSDGTMGVIVDLNGQGVPQPVSAEFGNVTLIGIENVTGTDYDDILTGDAGDNVLTGLNGNDILVGAAGNDTLLGGDGDDTLQGGEGDDVLDGGDGNNTADYSDATQDGLVVSLLTGSSSGGGLGNDSLSNIQNLTGSDYNDTLIGDDSDNIIVGGNGNDILWGHGGFNQLLGDAGTDVAYYIGKETDYAVFEMFGVRSITGGLEGVNDAMLVNDVERVKFLAPSHVSDIDNEGTSDLVFQNAAGNIVVTGSTPVFVGSVGGPTWRAVGTGQFDLDGNPLTLLDANRTADLLVQDTATGNLKVVTDLTGAATQTLLSSQPGSNAWKAIATGDFNGDAASDVVLQNQSTGAAQIMFLNTNSIDAVGTVASTQGLAAMPANWKVIAAGDFNGDGKSDILWQNSSTKQVQFRLMDGANVINSPVTQNAAGLTAVGTGDFNGDGFSDALFKNASGQAVIWFMYGDVRTGTKTVAKPGAAFNLSGASDVDGNGYSDLVWTDVSNNATATLLGGPSSLASTTVIGSSSLTHPGAGYNLLASTGGG